MDQRTMKGRISLILLTCIIQMCVGLPLQINFEAEKKEENVKEVPKDDPPDVFSIISASNKGSKMPMHEGDIALLMGRSALKCAGDYCRWTKNNTGIVNVPYTISSNFSEAYVSTIRKAMQEFETLTCVRFANRTTESDYVQIVVQSGCWSFVGRIGGGQPVSLGPECMGHGTVQHELNHVLGFYHEQSRSDRDNYVNINLANILPGTTSNFQTYDSNNLGLEYDYRSVMHYGRYAFSVANNLPTIVPKPDSSIDIGQRYGLSTLDIAKINKLYQCGLCRGLFSNTTGSIISSNYPNNYPSNTNCLWLIRIPSNQIFLQFSAFDVQASSGCASDYLRIYDGPSRSSPVLLDRSCGAGQLPSMISTGPTMLIEFVSDNRTEATGFKASYSTVTCGALLTGPSGNISSPMYPANYPPLMDCTWAINAPPGFVVSLNVTDFKVEFMTTCAFDYLLVFNGPQRTSPLIGRYCGNGIKAPSIRSTGNSLLLQFRSDSSIQLPGFFAKYAFVPQN